MRSARSKGKQGLFGKKKKKFIVAEGERVFCDPRDIGICERENYENFRLTIHSLKVSSNSKKSREGEKGKRTKVCSA